ncbi:MAG: GNAT family N-acetyltransferase [Actinomycetota bacterium]
MTVRRATTGDVRLVRELRLRALADSPDAFGATLEDESGRPEEMWLALVQGDGWGGSSVVFIAEDDGAVPAGLTIGVRHDDESPGKANLYAMWVDPVFRRRGHAGALVAAVIGWATDAGASVLRLAATATNPAALELYQGLGFTPTGEAAPLRTGSDLRCLALEREL